MKMNRFNFEDLEVWQKAVDFAEKVTDLAEKINTDRKHYRLIEQLEAASASISMNIAEGKGRYSKREFIQFLFIARGSLFETITILSIFYKKKWINDIQFDNLECLAEEINKMLSSLIKSIRNSIS